MCCSRMYQTGLKLPMGRSASRNSGKADAIAAKLRKECYVKIEDAQVGVFGAPPVDGLGNAGGFKIMVEDQIGRAHV